MKRAEITFSRFRRFLFPVFLLIPVLLLLLGGCSGKPVNVSVPEKPDEISRPELTPVSSGGEASVIAGARRLVLVIGDGMGTEQLRAASLYKTGTDDG
ncbi:MAG: hypothetical protein ACOCX6_03890, partial [bacterium]